MLDTPTVTIGLVAEGPVDHLILNHLLMALFLKAETTVVVNELQPIAPEPGGWTRVFDYCRTERIKEALHANDYVIVQIDTDTCEQPGFDVPRTEPGGRVLPVPELVERVRARLIAVMPASVQALVDQRVVFAISVHEIECWLLPWFVSKPATEAKITGCLNALNHELNRRFQFSVDPQNKRLRYYQRALADVRLCKDPAIFTKAGRQTSLLLFLREVQTKARRLHPVGTGPSET